MPTQDEKTIVELREIADARMNNPSSDTIQEDGRRLSALLDERAEMQTEIERLRVQANRDAAFQAEDAARIEKLEGAIRGLVAAAENGIGKGDKQGAVEWRDVLGFIAREGRRALEK